MSAAAASFDAGAAIGLLDGWIAARVPEATREWIRAQRAAIASTGEIALGKALGWTARRVGKADLGLSARELAQAATLRPGFDPSCWSLDQATRVSFVLGAFDGDEPAFARRLDRLADTAEINELIALYLGFGLYPPLAALEARAREAVRSGIRPVFEAIAHRNPFPVECFGEDAWNQMIAKTFFLDAPLWPIQGLERRANPALTRMLVDLARERRAAGRAIPRALWRCLRPDDCEAAAAEMARVLAEGADDERLAVCLSLAQASGAAADDLRARCHARGLAARAAALHWRALEAAPATSPSTDGDLHP